MRVVVLPGDGIGPEISEAALQVLTVVNQRFSLGVVFEQHEIGLEPLKREGTTFPAKARSACESADGIILGPVSHAEYPPRAEGGVNVSGDLRIGLDLFANIRPSKSRENLPHWGRTPMDLVIVRENTEGFYADRNMFLGPGEFMPTPEMALSVRKITATACHRVARTAFELANTRRKKVTAVHKANVLYVSEGLFLAEVRKVGSEFQGVAYNEQLVDSMAALLVRDASQFDVVVTTNMFGDILSDEAAELAGSLGLAGSLNAGDKHAMAQAQHGSAPDIAGKNVANPTSLILSAAMLLDWMGRRHALEQFCKCASMIEQSVDAVLRDAASRTPDLGGTAGTKEFTGALCNRIERQIAARQS